MGGAGCTGNGLRGLERDGLIGLIGLWKLKSDIGPEARVYPSKYTVPISRAADPNSGCLPDFSTEVI